MKDVKKTEQEQDLIYLSELYKYTKNCTEEAIVPWGHWQQIVPQQNTRTMMACGQPNLNLSVWCTA